MNDLISKSEALNAFDTNLDKLIVGGSENAKSVEQYLNGVIDEIKQLPIKEYDWIPCSERLPREEGFYLVTLKHRYGDEANIRFFKFENGEPYWSIWGNEIITAWMPKPIPYQTNIEVTE